MKAIALISGGLDSILAARIIKEQGVRVLPLNFKIPFCPRKKEGMPDNAINSLVKLNLREELKVVDVSADFLGLLLEPKYGFGSNMNPCIDCKIFMLKKAKELMQSVDAQFVVTGEVLGQRPMSQHRRALNLIEKESGLAGLLLRPLCAGLLPETLPEQEGWIKRNRLFKFSGRTRRPQMGLAKEFNMEHYPNASGGCLLTDPGFSVRLRDLIKYKGLSLENIGLLKLGRHFRLSENAKLIVGRNEEENKELEAASSCEDYLFMPDDNTAGPACLGRGEFDDQLVKLSSQIACHYCDLNGAVSAEIIYAHKEESYSRQAMPIAENRLASLRI